MGTNWPVNLIYSFVSKISHFRPHPSSLHWTFCLLSRILRTEQTASHCSPDYVLDLLRHHVLDVVLVLYLGSGTLEWMVLNSVFDEEA